MPNIIASAFFTQPKTVKSFLCVKKCLVFLPDGLHKTPKTTVFTSNLKVQGLVPHPVTAHN